MLFVFIKKLLVEFLQRIKSLFLVGKMELI